MRRRWLVLGALALLLIIGALVAAALNPRLTNYVQSDAFRAAMEKETAKGLHFPDGHFAPVQRAGFFTATTASFYAENGRKAMTRIDAHEITAKFNSLGVFLKRWQIDDLHIARGEVGIQTYEPKPEPSPAKPWYQIFLPSRVYLARVWSDPADVTWELRGKKAGFFGGHLLITPYGRDFEYDLTKATLRSPLVPALPLHHTHLLITKQLLTLNTLDLAAAPNDEGFIHAEGTAHTRGNKSVDFNLQFGDLPIGEWLPMSWREHVGGVAEGKIHWRGRDPKLQSAELEGTLRIKDGRVVQLPFLEKLAALTKQKSFERLELNECAGDFTWENRSGRIEKLVVEDKGKFRVEGTLSLGADSLGGTIQLGVAPDYLEWLPRAGEVFTRRNDGYLFTTMHLSGTPQHPQQDLSPRVLKALKESPGALLGAFLREAGEWIEETFRGD